MTSILVVDDEKMIANVLERVLRKDGFQVTCAHNGLEALRFLQRDTFNAVMMDMLMPELNGGEVLEWIRAHKPDLKVIMMTAYGDEHTKEELLQRGAAAVVAKPFEDVMIIPGLIRKIILSRP